MLSRHKIAQVLVVALVISLVLGACGGGETGEKTWFNFPSVKLVMQPDGSAKVLGFNIGQVAGLSPLIPQLQGGDVQKMELRAGSNGVHVYMNGDGLPYVDWDSTAMATLQDVLVNAPSVPNGAQIAQYLPWLRRIGLGASLVIPPAEGSAALDIQPWKGETSVISPTVPVTTTIGPMTIGSLVFDPDGNAIIAGVPAPTLEKAIGSQLNLGLDENVQSFLEALGVQTVSLTTTPVGVDLALNQDPLPGLAYDEASLAALTKYLPAMPVLGQNPDLVNTITKLTPLLQGMQVNAVVSFTGEPAVATDLGTVTLVVDQSGAIQSVAGIQLPGQPQALPADVVEKLQAANVQQLGVSMKPDGIVATSNGQMLPTVTWTAEGIATIAEIAAPMAGVNPALIDQGLAMIGNTGVDVKVELPVAEGAAPITIPTTITTTMAAPDLGDVSAPTIHLRATYADGKPKEIGGLPASLLAALGINLPELPPDLVASLNEQGVKEIVLQTQPGAFVVLLNGEPAMTINYDTASLLAALDLAKPFLGDSPVSSPAMQKLLREQIIPLVPGANVEIVVTLE
jgi:hypothetical protein